MVKRSLFILIVLSVCSRSWAQDSVSPIPGQAEFQEARACLQASEDSSDFAKAFALMQKAADLGNPDAIGAIGYFYAEGKGVPQDEKLAVDWFRRGAEACCAKAQFNLSRMLLNGRGVEKSEKESFYWVCKAADRGLPEAVVAAGNAFYFGDSGAERDYAKAYAYLLQAAEKGNIESQNTVGVILQDGMGGVESDVEQAGKLFRQAAEAGHAMAQFNLAQLLGVDSKVPSDRVQALAWLMISSAQGYVLATRSLDEAIPSADPAELTEARRIAASFSSDKSTKATVHHQ